MDFDKLYMFAPSFCSFARTFAFPAEQRLLVASRTRINSPNNSAFHLLLNYERWKRTSQQKSLLPKSMLPKTANSMQFRKSIIRAKCNRCTIWSWLRRINGGSFVLRFSRNRVNCVANTIIHPLNCDNGNRKAISSLDRSKDQSMKIIDVYFPARVYVLSKIFHSLKRAFERDGFSFRFTAVCYIDCGYSAGNFESDKCPSEK